MSEVNAASRSLKRLIEERLRDSRPPVDSRDALPGGISSEMVPGLRQYFPAEPAAAAVLIPIVDHADGLSVLLTQRASHLKNHAGQICFPGGRIEQSDVGAREAALREAEEEIGLSREHVAVAGFLEPHLILSGFWVTPVVAFVRPGFTLKLDSREVESAFEVPLSYVLDPSNHRARERRLGEVSVQVYDIPYRGYNIWGATAGMLLGLYRMLSQPK